VSGYVQTPVYLEAGKERPPLKRGQIENWEVATLKTKSCSPFSVASYLVRKQFLGTHYKK